MIQHTNIMAAVDRNPGAYIQTYNQRFTVLNKGRQHHVVARLHRADGSLISSAVGPTKPIALSNLDTRLSLR